MTAMRAMVLAAGLGTRLRPITYEMPKPMVPVLNRPVMEHILRLLARHGFGQTIANLHWFPELIEARFGDGSSCGVELSYRREEQLLGTSGGVRNAAEFLRESFLVISGDALTDIDLTAMREFHESHDAIATLATKRVEDTSQFGVAITGADGRIQGFQEKPDPAEALSDLANCGIYMFRSEIFDFFPDPGTSKAAGRGDPPGFADWAMDVFPRLLDGDVPFYSYEIDGYWNDIGNLEELRGGNLDALSGAVEVEHEGEIVDGFRSGTPEEDEGALTGPVLLGPGCEIADDVRIDGPAVIGDGVRVGAGSRLREVIALPGAEISAGSVLVGAIAGRRG
ncbi:MAG TPA: NDP-sugar synthase [Solirubrobacterales bacterium]|jgi:Nucleoside-diphosphate-sugar pyrophosphorylase involved in lipopolysaccharide biosynthesis/translation initiation factor 2B, gamma/epsilon subunits (eIF-2Bgamma/eIF-2Bepsilon)|nr:NDP-sugar synthase [Solirubrobacterales bacterium]